MVRERAKRCFACNRQRAVTTAAGSLKIKPPNLPEVHHLACQGGFALLLALIALSLFSVVGLYLSLTATSEVRISDNYEGYIQARAAALAGLNHARALLKGLRFGDLLEGPDGTHDTAPAYLAYARTHGYRCPVDWSAARMLDILDPAGSLAGAPDDGIVSTGWHPGGNGLALIPVSGIPLFVPNPQGRGALVVSRYFVKVSDNSGEASELAGDPTDNPFVDGDGQVIVRSMGLARTLHEDTRAGTRRNSVALFEARFKRFATFDLDAPLVVQGNAVEPASADMFGGNLFFIQGGGANFGIAAISTAAGGGATPLQQILDQLTPAQQKNIQGAGLEPSVRDITSSIASHPDKKLLLDKSYLWRFVKQSVRQFADSAYSGPQDWVGAAPASLGSYDLSQPPTSPSQDPRVTYVDGDLFVGGSLEGAGLLVITGKASVTGQLSFNGVILIIGAGELDCGGSSAITGAVYVTKLSDWNGNLNWGTARLTVREACHITFNREVVGMAVNLIPPVQVSFREITSAIDP
jgi:hypothetical protein